MSSRVCQDCGSPVSARRVRCRPCKLEFRAEKAREKYHAQERVTTPDDSLDLTEEVVDYSKGGAPRPNLDPNFPYRRNPRHDHAARVHLDQANSAGEADMLSWDSLNDLQAIKASGRFVSFPPAQNVVAPDPLGRSVPRSRGLYSREERGGYEVPTGIIVRSSGAGERAVAAQQQSRFGGGVSIPAPLQSGHFESSAPHLRAREAVQIEQQRQASEHAHKLFAGALRDRRDPTASKRTTNSSHGFGWNS